MKYKFSILKSVGVFVLGLSFSMSSNVAVAEEDNIAIPLASYEKLIMRLEKLEAELAELKDENKMQDSMIEAELVELKDDKKKQDSMVNAKLAKLKDKKEKQEGPPSSYYAEAQVLFLKAYSSHNTAFLINDSGIADDDSTEARPFDDEWDAGYRVEIGYMPQAGLGWAARYWHFDTEQTASVVDEDTNVWFADDPNIQIDDGGDITASREFDLDVGDIAATFVTRSGNTTVKYSAGIRVLDSNLTGFWFNPADDGDNNVRIDNEYTGAGPLLGADITHPLFQNSTTNVNVYAGGSVAMLYGDGELLLNADDGDDLVVVDREDGIVYNGEVRFGLEAIFKRSPKSLIEYFATVGLEGQYWAGIGAVASRPGHSGDSNHLLNGDLGLLGGNFMLGVRGEF